MLHYFDCPIMCQMFLWMFALSVKRLSPVAHTSVFWFGFNSYFLYQSSRLALSEWQKCSCSLLTVSTWFASAELGLCIFSLFILVYSYLVLINVAPQTWDQLQSGISSHTSIAKYSLLKTAVRSSFCLVWVLHLSACGA